MCDAELAVEVPLPTVPLLALTPAEGTAAAAPAAAVVVVFC